MKSTILQKVVLPAAALFASGAGIVVTGGLENDSQVVDESQAFSEGLTIETIQVSPDESFDLQPSEEAEAALEKIAESDSAGEAQDVFTNLPTEVRDELCAEPGPEPAWAEELINEMADNGTVGIVGVDDDGTATIVQAPADADWVGVQHNGSEETFSYGYGPVDGEAIDDSPGDSSGVTLECPNGTLLGIDIESQ